VVLVDTLAELLHQLGAEGGQIGRLAARDEAAVDHELRVLPGAARVLDIGLETLPGRQRAALHDARLDERPDTVADGPDRLPLLEEGTHEGDCVLVRAQDVRVDYPAREYESVVVRRLGVLDRLVGRERLALVVVVEALDLALLQRDQHGLAAGLLDRLPGLGQLDLLDPVGRQERDALAAELVAHVSTSSVSVSRSAYPARERANAQGARRSTRQPPCASRV